MTSVESLEKRLLMENLGLKGAIGEKDVLIARLRQIVRRLEKNNRALEKERDKFKRLAATDHLTAIPNRRHFEEMASDILFPHLNGSRKTDRPNKNLVFTLIDIYKFKEVNDKLGHDTGDDVLKDLAQSIQTCVREGDAFGRVGGDEFAIFFEDEYGFNEALFSFAQRISLHLLKRIESKLGENQSFGISVGIFVMGEIDQIVWKMRETYFQSQQEEQKFTPPDCLLHTPLLKYLKRKAELLMKKAKRDGKNRVCIGRYPETLEESQIGNKEEIETIEGLEKMNLFEKDI